MAKKPTYEELEQRVKKLEKEAVNVTDRKLAEEAFKSERDFNSAVLSTIGALIIVLDPDGRITNFNKACEQLTGYSFDDVNGKVFWDLFLIPEEINSVKAVFLDLRSGQFPNKHENYWVTKDGRRRLISWSNTALIKREDTVEHIIATGIDITERKQAQEALRKAHDELEWRVEERTGELVKANEQLKIEIEERRQAEEGLKALEQRLAQTINFLPDATMVIDLEGKVIAWNRAIENLTGIKAQDMLGKGNYEYAIPFYGERRPVLIDIVSKWDKEIEKEYRYIKKEGESLVSEAYDSLVKPGGFLWNKACLLYDHNGEVIGAIESTRDITDRKVAEEALRESEEKYRGLVETITDGLAIQDKNGLLIYVNNRFCKMVDYQQDELIGKPIIDLLDEGNKQIVKGEIARRRKGAPAQSYETEITRKDGGQLSVFLSPRDILDSDGQFGGSFAVFTDISSRKQAEEALKKAHDHLEMRVEERTADLASVNRNLEEEMIQRKYAWEKLKQKEKELKNKTTELRETNTALNVLLKRREMDKEEVEEKVVSNVKALIAPYLEKLKKTNLTPTQDVYLNILKSNLVDILSPFLRNLAIRHSGLTPKEIEVGNLVKEGKNTKEIADLLNTTKRAVEFHRHSLRKKLGLKNTKANLRSYLMSLP